MRGCAGTSSTAGDLAAVIRSLSRTGNPRSANRTNRLNAENRALIPRCLPFERCHGLRRGDRLRGSHELTAPVHPPGARGDVTPPSASRAVPSERPCTRPPRESTAPSPPPGQHGPVLRFPVMNRRTSRTSAPSWRIHGVTAAPRSGSHRCPACSSSSRTGARAPGFRPLRTFVSSREPPRWHRQAGQPRLLTL